MPRMSETVKSRIRELYENGVDMTAIAVRMGFSRNSVKMLLDHKARQKNYKSQARCRKRYRQEKNNKSGTIF